MRLITLNILLAVFATAAIHANNLWPESEYPSYDGVKHVGMGQIQEVSWPWIYHHDHARWLYIEPQSQQDNIRFYRANDERWLWTQEALGQVAYNYSAHSWEGVAEEVYAVYYYLQGFANNTGGFQGPMSYGWTFFFGAGGVSSSANRIHYFLASEAVENVNAPAPHGDNIENGSWTGNSSEIQLAYTLLDLSPEQAEAALLTMDINTSQNPMPMHFAIQAGGEWYISHEAFIDNSPTWLRCELPVGGDTEWLPLTFSSGVILRKESGPILKFSDIDAEITAVGSYMEPTGTHRFDNYGVILPSNLVEDGSII